MNKLRVSYSKLTFNFHFMLDQTSLATLFLFFYSCLGLNRTSFYKYHQSACQKEHVAFCNIFMSVEVRIHHHVIKLCFTSIYFWLPLIHSYKQLFLCLFKSLRRRKNQQSLLLSVHNYLFVFLFNRNKIMIKSFICFF